MRLTEYQKDIFKEIGNVGIGNGATALSQMISREVKISFPYIRLIGLSDAFDSDTQYLASKCMLEGDLNGSISALFEHENGRRLIDLMFFKESGSTKAIGDDEKGAYNEMLNVVGGCYLNALADMLKLRIMPKPPSFTEGKGNLIRENLFQGENPETFLVKTDFEIDGEKIQGNIFLALDEESSRKILKLLDSI